MKLLSKKNLQIVKSGLLNEALWFTAAAVLQSMPKPSSIIGWMLYVIADVLILAEVILEVSITVKNIKGED